MSEKIDLPILEKDDYLTKGSKFWKEYRQSLYKFINQEEERLEKTQENIVRMAKEIGIKPTARYFNISPSTVRYNINKNI